MFGRSLGVEASTSLAWLNANALVTKFFLKSAKQDPHDLSCLLKTGYTSQGCKACFEGILPSRAAAEATKRD
eukprot:366519-Amphidinium_carterae.1